MSKLVGLPEDQEPPEGKLITLIVVTFLTILTYFLYHIIKYVTS